jgi:hypothetical protein
VVSRSLLVGSLSRLVASRSLLEGRDGLLDGFRRRVPVTDTVVTVPRKLPANYINSTGEVKAKIHWYMIDLTDEIYLDWIEFPVLDA